MTAGRFTVTVGLTGDSADAATLEAALVAADTLAHDAADALPVQGRLRATRASIVIAEDGVYAGFATALARQGHRLPLSVAWSG